MRETSSKMVKKKYVRQLDIFGVQMNKDGTEDTVVCDPVKSFIAPLNASWRDHKEDLRLKL